MAKYSRYELKKAAAEGRRIGGYQGYDVRCCSASAYQKNDRDFFVIYDDGNKLVRNGWVYGSITENGNVHEVDSIYEWKPPVSKTPKPQKETKKVPASDYSAYVAGAAADATSCAIGTDDFFVNLDREINELLAQSFVFDVVKDMPWVNN